MTNNTKTPDLDVVMTSRIRLARNFEDLPFSTEQSQGIANVCIQRVEETMSQSQQNGEYIRFTMEDLSPLEQSSLLEDHFISRDLTKHQSGALLLRKDKKIALMINEEDHIRLQAIEKGASLLEAAEHAFTVEDILQEKLHFAYDDQLGYLTACPTNTGTGMRASYMFHLPMLTLFNQMGNVNQSVAKLGLTIRGMYGEGSETLGNIYQVSNQITLGKTEEEITASVMAVGKQIVQMERELRKKAYESSTALVEDHVFRSLGLLRYAKQMTDREFMKHWSNLRVGAALELLPIALEEVDALLSIGQDAHVKSNSLHNDKQLANIDIERPKQIQAFLEKHLTN